MILQKGKLNVGPVDLTWGSSSKGKISDYIANTEELDFAISHNTQNSSHVTVFDDDTSYKFQCLPSSVSNQKVKIVIGADTCVQLDTLLKEIKDWKLTPERLFIHPNVVIISEENIKYEEEKLGRIGSTMTGVGAAKAAKVLRDENLITADMIEELKPFIANTHRLVIEWLREGQTGLLETSQGFDLSTDLVYDDGDVKNVNKFFPFTTSRVINPAYFVGLSFVPHKFIGSVILNLRTYPIRVGDSSNNQGDITFKFENGSERACKNKVIVGRSLDGGKNINHSYIDFAKNENKQNFINSFKKSPNEFYFGKDKIKSIVELGSSGKCYPDQKEITWEEISERCGEKVLEMTSLTKRLRRCFEPSVLQIKNATMCCMPTHITINFVNYLDKNIKGAKGKYSIELIKETFPKVYDFIKFVEDNQYYQDENKAVVKYLGTGPRRSEIIEII